ncbi:MAG: hypothetical protein HWE30_06490 [Methylocystaceae bacterium]|nr:hypothetical protein [Methylocystaceae bacterium]
MDQFFLSHTFRGKEKKFIDAAKRIENLAAKQLLIVPFSSLHEDETYQWERHSELIEFIKETSRGHEFLPDYQVEQNQLTKAFESWISGAPPFYKKSEDDVFPKNIHEWESYYRIDVGQYTKDRELVRELKKQSVDSLVDIFDGWRASNTTFEEDVIMELNASAKSYLDSYFLYVERILSGDLMAQLNAPIMSRMVEALLLHTPNDISSDKRLKMIIDFFTSEHFRLCPYQNLSAKIFAALKLQVKQGAYANDIKARKKLSGFFYDVSHISNYAPYCHAFFADKSMSQLVARPEVSLSKNYEVKVFSVETMDDFLCWLESLEEEMTEEHIMALRKAYPKLVLDH